MGRWLFGSAGGGGAGAAAEASGGAAAEASRSRRRAMSARRFFCEDAAGGGLVRTGRRWHVVSRTDAREDRTPDIMGRIREVPGPHLTSPPLIARGSYRLLRLYQSHSFNTRRWTFSQIAAFNASAPEEIVAEHVDAPPGFARAVHPPPRGGIRIADRPAQGIYIDGDEEWLARFAERPRGAGGPGDASDESRAVSRWTSVGISQSPPRSSRPQVSRSSSKRACHR